MSISRKIIAATLVLAAVVLAVTVAMRRSASSESRYRQALAALEKNDLRTTLLLARQLADDPEFEEHARYLRAASLIRTGDQAGAIAELSSPPRRDELRVPMTLLVVEAFYRSGRLSEAEGAARHLLTLDADNVAGHRWLASILYDLGATQAALEELQLLQKLAPDDYTPWHLIAQIQFDAEQYGPAIEACREALRRHPRDLARQTLVRQLVGSLIRLHDFRAALDAATAEFGREESPGADLMALMAECQWALGETSQAETLMGRAMSHDPHEPLVLVLRARILSERGETAAAIPLFEELLRNDPHDFESRYKLATALRQQGDSDRATTEMERMRESQSLRRRLADLSSEAANRPEDAEVRDELASVCDTLGKHELAQNYRRAAEACRQRAAGLIPAGPRHNSSSKSSGK